MRVLVTGAAGFIGSHVVDRLIDAGCDVLGVDVLHPAAHSSSPDYLNPRMDFEEIDLVDGEGLSGLMKGVDAVSHQAAMVGMGKSIDDAPEYVLNNDLATAVLLRELARAGFSGPVVLASSMAVYGEGAYRCHEHGIVRPPPRREADLNAGVFDHLCPSCGRSLEPLAITEEFPPEPRNIYAATKLHQEHLCFSFGRETRTRVVALRYHNVYGPRMPADSPYSGVAASFRSAIEEGRPPLVFEDGCQLRDFIHVEDVAEANLQAVYRSDASGSFNIATGEPRSIGEMAQSLWKGTSGSGPPPRITGSFRLGDVRHVFASPDRASDFLDFRVEVDFAAGLERFAGESLRAVANSS